MKLKEIKELMTQFDQSDLREFSYQVDGEELYFSKNETQKEKQVTIAADLDASPVLDQSDTELASESGEVMTSPLVGIAYLSPAPDKAPFVEVGSRVKAGQVIMLIEAMKIMNEVVATRDGVIADILVQNQEMVEFGQGLVRLND